MSLLFGFGEGGLRGSCQESRGLAVFWTVIQFAVGRVDEVEQLLFGNITVIKLQSAGFYAVSVEQCNFVVDIPSELSYILTVSFT